MGDVATKTAPSRYRVFRIKGQPVFATPVSPKQLRLAGLARLQPFTPKRAMYRRVMHLSMLLGVDRFLAKSAASPIEPSADFDFKAWFDQARADLGEPGASAVVFWPPQRDRGRIYVHIFDQSTRPIGFAKVASDHDNDQRLVTEAKTLAALQAEGLQECHVPAVLSAGWSHGHYYVILEPIPTTAQPLEATCDAYPSQCVEEFAGTPRMVEPEHLDRLAWWQRFCEATDNRCGAFFEQLRQLARNGVRVRRAHGDFRHANIVRVDGGLWVYDWEESCDDAPALADEVSFYLGINFKKILADPLPVLSKFAARHLRNAHPQRRTDIMLALAFHHTAGFEDASLFIKHWERIEGTSN
ncbi:MAG: hypothetical protein V3T84_17050 [Phycisphaerales bacterium]